MRITNSMITNTMLASINRNKQIMSKLDRQMATGKKVEKPSDDPMVTARALKFRTSVSEIEMYETNAKDSNSWMSISEQAIKNTNEILKRMRELANQGANDTLTSKSRKAIIEEYEQLKEQIMSEANVSYAGRRVFSGYKTDNDLLFDKQVKEKYVIQEVFTSENVEKIEKVYNNRIHDVHRIRLGYKEVVESTPAGTIEGFTVVTKSTADADAYAPSATTVHLIEDTGELIFHKDDVANIPEPLGFSYQKNTFEKGDPKPEHYLHSTNISKSPSEMYNKFVGLTTTTGAVAGGTLDAANQVVIDKDTLLIDGEYRMVGTTTADTVELQKKDGSGTWQTIDTAAIDTTTGEVGFTVGTEKVEIQIEDYTAGDFTAVTDILNFTTAFDASHKQDSMEYQVSYSQTIQVNTMGFDVFTQNMIRDIEEIISYNRGIKDDGSTDDDLKKSLTSKEFNKFIGQLDKHIDNVVNQETKIGAKVNRIELTLSRLKEDNLNVTKLLTQNEDVNMAKTLIEFSSHKAVYNQALAASGQIIQQTLLDFLR